MSYLHLLFSLFLLIFCQSCLKDEVCSSANDQNRTIVIMHDNDVHCRIDGYAKFAGLRDAIAASDTAYVAAVSSGDFVQGEFTGAYSRGSYIIDVMKSVGYDAVTVGNHEFDYGIDRQKELLGVLGEDKVVCSNFINTDSDECVYARYLIRKVGVKKIAFLGVITPGTVVSEYSAFRDGSDILPYDIPEDRTVSLVQEAVNDARQNGADYVILLSHLGYTEDPNSEVYAIPLINQTKGIDAVLDGHTHSVVQEQFVKNLEGKDVLYTQTGTGFRYFGKLTISATGAFHSECIPDSVMVGYSSKKVQCAVDSINALCASVKAEKVGHTAFDLTIYDENGQRIIRKRETNLSDLVSDAFMHAGGGRVSFINAGAIRNVIKAGEITFGNVVDVLPFGNELVDFEITGKKIIEALESSYKLYPAESGALLHAGGLKFTYDSSKSPHICDVQVVTDDGSYIPISDSSTYRATTTNYVLNDLNSYPSFEGCTHLRECYLTDCDALRQYIRDLGGEIPERYCTSQNRVTVK